MNSFQEAVFIKTMESPEGYTNFETNSLPDHEGSSLFQHNLQERSDYFNETFVGLLSQLRTSPFLKKITIKNTFYIWTQRTVSASQISQSKDD